MHLKPPITYFLIFLWIGQGDGLRYTRWYMYNPTIVTGMYCDDKFEDGYTDVLFTNFALLSSTRSGVTITYYDYNFPDLLCGGPPHFSEYSPGVDYTYIRTWVYNLNNPGEGHNDASYPNSVTSGTSQVGCPWVSNTDTSQPNGCVHTYGAADNSHYITCKSGCLTQKDCTFGSNLVYTSPGTYKDPKSCEYTCNKGYEKTSTGCVACVKGYGGSDNTCQQCLAGTFTPGSAYSACIQCTAGKYNFLDGSTACLSCVGTPSASVGANECIQNIAIGSRVQYTDPRSNGLRSFRLNVQDVNDGWYGVLTNTGNTWQHSGGSPPYSIYIGSDPYPTFYTGWYNLWIRWYENAFYFGPYKYTHNDWTPPAFVNGSPIYLGVIIENPNQNGANTIDFTIVTQPSLYYCPAGRQGWDPSTLACDYCPTGKYSPGVKPPYEGCVDCESGKYQPDTGSSACRSCAECQPGSNKYNCGPELVGECAQCQVGTYSDVSANPCSNCPTGKYADAQGSTACKSCADCSQGYYKTDCTATARGTCTPCSPGTVGLSINACSSCAAGTYSAEYGSTGCKPCNDCPNGYYKVGCSTSSKGTCTECTNV